MKKLLSIILSVAMLLSSSVIAFADTAGGSVDEKQNNATYITTKIPIPDDLKDTSAWDIIARYKDTKEPITLSYGFQGYVYATIPAEHKNREIEAVIPEAKKFTDYTNDVYGEFHSVIELSKTGVILGNGKGEAKPNDNVTRAEAVAMIMRFLGLENVPRFDKTISFEDVNKNDWFYPAVTSAYNCGIVEGDSETKFSPYRNVTREEVCVMIVRACKYAGLNCGVTANDYNISQDEKDISEWAKDSYDFLGTYCIKDVEHDDAWNLISRVYYYPQKSAQRKDIADILNDVQRACQFYPLDLAIEYGFDKEMPVIDGSTSTYPFTQAVYDKLFFNGDNHPIYPRKHSKSHDSYEKLINGEVDMLFASVYPANDILALAKEKGVELDLIPIAYDAMIFFTNANNPATNLTKEQISEIYVNNKYDNWSQIGGPDALLYPYCRNNDSGSHAQMEKHFLNGNEIHEKIRNETTSVSMSNVLTDVKRAETDEPIGYGLGYSIYYYYHNMDPFYNTSRELKLLSIDGVQPTDETIADGTYPLSNNTYVVLRKDTPKDASARKMAEFMLTEAGQECVQTAGYGRLIKPEEKIDIEELGLTLILPDTWKNKYALEKTDNGEYIVYNPDIRYVFSQENKEAFTGGMLFYIIKWDKKLTESEVNAGGDWNFAKNKYIATTDDGTYLLYYATDVQFTKETENEYRQMESEIENIEFVIN